MGRASTEAPSLLCQASGIAVWESLSLLSPAPQLPPPPPPPLLPCLLKFVWTLSAAPLPLLLLLLLLPLLLPPEEARL